MSSDDKLAEQIERLADEQKKTADMLESLLYAYIQTNSPEVRVGKMSYQDYWKVEPPFDE